IALQCRTRLRDDDCNQARGRVVPAAQDDDLGREGGKGGGVMALPNDADARSQNNASLSPRLWGGRGAGVRGDSSPNSTQHQSPVAPGGTGSAGWHAATAEARGETGRWNVARKRSKSPLTPAPLPPQNRGERVRKWFMALFGILLVALPTRAADNELTAQE